MGQQPQTTIQFPIYLTKTNSRNPAQTRGEQPQQVPMSDEKKKAHPWGKIEDHRKEIEAILHEVIKENDYDSHKASEWARTAQQKIFNKMRKDHYKLVVVVEIISAGAGYTQKTQYLTSPDHDLSISVQTANEQGVRCVALVCALRY